MEPEILPVQQAPRKCCLCTTNPHKAYEFILGHFVIRRPHSVKVLKSSMSETSGPTGLRIRFYFRCRSCNTLALSPCTGYLNLFSHLKNEDCVTYILFYFTLALRLRMPYSFDKDDLVKMAMSVEHWCCTGNLTLLISHLIQSPQQFWGRSGVLPHKDITSELHSCPGCSCAASGSQPPKNPHGAFSENFQPYTKPLGA